MPTYSITGTIKQIGQTQEISPTFKKRELILLEPVGNRDQPVPIEFIQDDGAMLDQFAPGEKVTVSFFINGREWTARDGTVKYFLSLKGQRIDRVDAPAPGAGAPASNRGRRAHRRRRGRPALLRWPSRTG